MNPEETRSNTILEQPIFSFDSEFPIITDSGAFSWFLKLRFGIRRAVIPLRHIG